MPTDNRARTATAATPKVAEPPAVAPGIKLPADQKFAFHPVETVQRLPALVPPGMVIGRTPAPVMPHSGHVDPNSPIGQRYIALGGAAALGQPFFDEQPTPDGRGTYQAYDHGAIFYAPAFGAVLLSSDIYVKWDSLSAATTADGDNVRRA